MLYSFWSSLGVVSTIEAAVSNHQTGLLDWTTGLMSVDNRSSYYKKATNTLPFLVITVSGVAEVGPEGA